MNMNTTGESTVEERIAALPRQTEKQRRANIGRLLKRYALKNNTTMNWMKDPKRLPRCGGVLVSGAIPDTMVHPTDANDRLHKVFINMACSNCPLTVECYEFGIKNDYPGVWGGKLITQAEIDKRRATARQKRREQRVAAAG
jgi:hypothetical protein